MDMIAGTVLRPGVAHGPLRILETLPDGPAAIAGLARAVVAVRGDAAANFAAALAAMETAPADARPVAWFVPTGIPLPPGLTVPVIAFDPATLARLIPCPRASLQPGGRVWLT